MSEKIPRATRLSSYLLFVVTVLVLVVVVYVRVRLLNLPLERDEGEYAYMGQLLLKGFPPFIHAYTMKLPGVTVMYAFFMLLFGQSPAGIHAGLLIVNILCIGLVYLLAKRMFDGYAALVSCTTYAVLSLSQSVLGIFAHATHFVVLFSLAGFLMLLRYFDNRRIRFLFVSGLCFGLAVTMKQHGAVLVLFAFIYHMWRVRANPATVKEPYLPGTVLFLLGTVIPYVLIVLWMLLAGAFDDFWFWTVQYAREYAANRTLLQGAKDFAAEISPLLAAQPFLWILAISGGVLLCTKFGRCKDKWFVFGFLGFSFMAICPGLVFRAHYFVLLLPAVALLAGAAVHSSTLLLTRSKPAARRQCIPVAIWMVAILCGVCHERVYLFALSPLEESRQINGANPFPEAVQVSRYLKEHTSPDDRVLVLGSEPEIYFYADRLSATGHIYMYGLMEDQPFAEQMQMQMIHEILAAQPKYIVVVNVPASWLTTGSSKSSILVWGETYIRDLYSLVGIVDLVDPTTIVYAWDGKVADYSRASNIFLSVFKRKDGV